MLRQALVLLQVCLRNHILVDFDALLTKDFDPLTKKDFLFNGQFIALSSVAFITAQKDGYGKFHSLL